MPIFHMKRDSASRLARQPMFRPAHSQGWAGGSTPFFAPASSRGPSPNVQAKCEACETSAQRTEQPEASGTLPASHRHANGTAFVPPSAPTSNVTVQARMTLGAPNDRFEQEADAMAERVMAMPERGPLDPQQSSSPPSAGMQRLCPECEKKEATQTVQALPTTPLAHRITPLLQRQAATVAEGTAEEAEETAIQSKPAADQPVTLAPSFQTRIAALSAERGQPLPASERAFFEACFGTDFSSVRIHTDSHAAETAGAIRAQAFTRGHNIVFGTNHYRPGSTAGRRLLAHELTHVLQQNAADRGAQRLLSAPRPKDTPMLAAGDRTHDGAAEPGSPTKRSAAAISRSVTPVIQRTCGSAAIGAPAGCTEATPVFLPGYPMFRFDSDCDDLAPGEKARLISHVTTLPADAAFEIHGFSSVAGDPTFNKNLSCARVLKANGVLTDPSPTGAGIASARIVGMFSHGPTPGPSAGRTGVVLTPQTPTALPSVVPVPGPTDFQINRIGTSTTSRLFFARGASALDVAAATQITAIKTAAPASVRLIGFASADEPAAVAQDRADAVKTALTTPPHTVAVTSAVGNAAATKTRSDFTQARSVEVLIGAAAPTTLDCDARDAAGNLVNPPKQPCPTMDPNTWTAFNTALPIAKDAMTRAVAAVAGVPSADDAIVIDRFFGNHSAATLTTLRTNLANLQTNVNSLPGVTQCGGQCDAGGCAQGPIAYHTPASAAPAMTLCVPVFKSLHVNDQARNLIHETAHGTTPLGGAPGTGTRDVAYRHERMLFHLAPADRLRNSDSYALFVMFLREIQTTGIASAVPAGISTPASDTLTGFTSGQQSALELALARLEKRLTWAQDWVGQLYGQVNRVRTGALTWAASWAENLMTEAARRFPLTAPPAAPSLTDQIRVAGILDRYERMQRAVKRNLTVTLMATGVANWPVAATWVAGDTLQVGPDFFRATPDHQVSLLLEHLARATRDVEAAFVPAYVSLAAWIHAENP